MEKKKKFFLVNSYTYNLHNLVDRITNMTEKKYLYFFFYLFRKKYIQSVI
jgi:hypothetical protein